MQHFFGGIEGTAIITIYFRGRSIKTGVKFNPLILNRIQYPSLLSFEDKYTHRVESVTGMWELSFGNNLAVLRR